MSAGIGSDLFRTVFAVLIGVLVAYTGLPDTAKAHVTETDKLHVSHDDRGPAANHHSDTAPTFGHCHPGLDCFTAAAFLLDPSLPTPAEASEETVWFSKLETDRWIPSSDKPPPRHFS
jgi:hypothetical protein